MSLGLLEDDGGFDISLLLSLEVLFPLPLPLLRLVVDPLRLVVLAQVAVFTHTLGIKNPVFVSATRALLLPPLRVVAVLAHTIGVVGLVGVEAVRYYLSVLYLFVVFFTIRQGPPSSLRFRL